MSSTEVPYHTVEADEGPELLFAFHVMFGKEKGNYSIALNEDDIRGGSLSLFEGREVFFDDEIEEAHAEELAAGTSSRDTIHIFDSESDIDSGSYPPSALIRYPVYDGGGDIADGLPADRMGHQYPIPPRYVDAKQLAFSSRQPDPSWLKRDISNATSTLPAGYVEMIGTTRRRRRYLSPERQRCIGGTLSAAGVFVLGFMLVLIGHAWYEKNNPTTEDSSKDADNSIWTVVQTVTYAPMSPSQAPSISADEQSEDDLEYGYENYDTWNGKLSNVSTAEPSEAGFATPPPLQPESLPDVFSRIYRLHHENDPIQVSLNTGQRLYMGRPGCGNSLDENATSSLLVHIPEVTHTISTTAQIGEVSVQLALESDTSFSVCHELSNEPTAVLNYILVPAVNNTNEVRHSLKCGSWFTRYTVLI